MHPWTCTPSQQTWMVSEWGGGVLACPKMQPCRFSYWDSCPHSLHRSCGTGARKTWGSGTKVVKKAKQLLSLCTPSIWLRHTRSYHKENKQSKHANTYNIRCFNLFLGRPIDFVYRRLICVAFSWSNFLPFFFGLQIWQIHIPASMWKIIPIICDNCWC